MFCCIRTSNIIITDLLGNVQVGMKETKCIVCIFWAAVCDYILILAEWHIYMKHKKKMRMFLFCISKIPINVWLGRLILHTLSSCFILKPQKLHFLKRIMTSVWFINNALAVIVAEIMNGSPVCHELCYLVHS